MNKTDDNFAKEAKALFDESVDKQDAATLSSLNQARHRAIEELHGRRMRWVTWAPAAGVTAAVIAAVMMASPGQMDTLPANAADMEILLGEESIEMLEDLEFYTWIDMLEEENDVG